MPEIINIVEPTLTNEAGHCYSFISSFCKACDENRTIRLWVDRHAEVSFAGRNIHIRKYFNRALRRLQSYILYKRLLRTPGRIFISTAGSADFLLLDWAAKGVLPPKKAFLYSHWFRPNDKKIGRLKKLALKQPNLEILGPTPSVVKIFQDAGFKNAHVVPYPISEQEVVSPAGETGFRHLLYAGAARRDKGFSHVVDLVEYLQARGLQIPVALQTSPEHYGKYDALTKADIQRLHLIAYPHLQLSPETLNNNEYAALFDGAICIQLYDTADFVDRISGVTLDAFSAGCPIVASPGTWIARMAQRFDAGIVVEDMSPTQVLSAVQRIISEYARYNKHAIAAGKTLQEENNADALFKVITK
ncbi:MAG: glycosyltransferase [Gammaproteobacteria bacterium]|nr:glycosyltransferase [Gammaproteobacteria bacterium]MBU1481687.1 glycosyltransferase [Gammaproteobacteria bacterium]